MILIYLQLSCHSLCHLVAVAREHHRLLHTQLLQLAYSLSAVRLCLVADYDMSCIAVVYSHMYYGALIAMLTLMPLGTNHLHHLRVTHTDHLVAHLSADALACYLFHIAH